MWRARIGSVVALLLIAAASADAASLLDPRLGFRVLPTEHFAVYFHQGEDAQARRLCAIAEEVWSGVSTTLNLPAPRFTHVILADQTELANGWATPLPRNTIFVTTAAPSGSDYTGRNTDWLRLVFIHEFTHIVHLDLARGWASVARHLLGRNPVAFPNLFLPGWQIEGIAAWEESALTGEGRLHAGDFRLIEGEAARAGRFAPIDRSNGGLIDWPDGFAVYAYGLGFHDYLVERFGAATLGQLAARTAGRLPYFGSRAFRAVYGESLGTLWAAYRADRVAAASRAGTVPAADNPTATRLTNHGQVVVGPRFTPGCDDCADAIVYSVNHPDGFPALRTVARDGSRPRRLADRFQGSTVGVGAKVIIFDQLEWRRNSGLYSDLYAFDRHTGRQRQLTRESRIEDPDLSPDARTIVGVREQRGRRELVLLPLRDESLDGPPAAETTSLSGADREHEWAAGPVTVLLSEPDVQFNAPRWSPDGRKIAVARRRLGVLSEIVLVDPASGGVQTIAAAPATRIVTPTWRPDGQAIVAAADANEGPFDLYEFAADGLTPAGRRLTALPGGATWPDISADSQTVVFVGYTVDGFDLYTIPYPAGTGQPIASSVPSAPPTKPADAAAAVSSPRRYSPLRTLAPTSWSPIVTGDLSWIRAGVGIAGSDVLARHAYAITTTWLVRKPDDAGDTNAASPDFRLGYAYDRWRPTLFAWITRETNFRAGPPDATGRPTRATQRSSNIESGILFPVRHVRSTHRVLASVIRASDRFNLVDRDDVRTQTAARVGWASGTARRYGYSISPEHGVLIGATAEFAGGSRTRAATITVDARGYLPGAAAHHVLALRAAGGWSDGDRGGQRIFHLGGANASGDVIDFGYQAISLLRGFPSDSFAGPRVAVANADYRVPLARPQRGIGTLPLFIQRLHATMFADAGNAWTDRFNRRELKVSAGAELAVDVVAGYSLPLTIATGAAWGRGDLAAARGGTAYIRVGGAF